MKIENKIALLGGKDVWHTAEIKEDEKTVPSIMMCDGPHGLRKQVDSQDNLGINNSFPATLFPTAATAACSFNPGLIYRMGEAIGKEARENDVQMVLGPGINIKRNPLCGRNFEYYSEDPYLSGTLGYAWIRGLQSQNVGASLKHFACNNQETFRFTTDSIVDERALREIYLKGFEIAIKANPATVMCSYNKVNGEYASENKHLLTDILRKEWNYQGAVVSDWGAVSNRVLGVKSGLDLEMPSSGGYHYQKLLESYKKGELSEGEIDTAVQRVLQLVDRYKNNFVQPFDEEEHLQIAREIAAESIVLLKNEDVLPLRKSERIAVVGKFAKHPRIQGGGSSNINPYQVEKLLDEINEYTANYRYFEGYSLEKDGYDQNLIEEVCQEAKDFDKIIILCGLPESYETEGCDRKHMDLPYGQTELIEAVQRENSNVIIILFSGSPVTMPFCEDSKAIIACHLPGSACAKPLLDILYGIQNPSGRLAQTYPINEKDDPSSKNYADGNNAVWYEESIYVGYRYYTTYRKPVLFPFGYGLSYTKFEYSNLWVSEENIEPGMSINVKCNVKNIGNTAGKEVVLLFIENNHSSVDKPLRELRRYDKIYLSPGEEKEVSFSLKYSDFSYYDCFMHKFTVNEGIYKIQICTDSEHVLMEKDIARTENEEGYREHPVTNYHNHKQYKVTCKDFQILLGKELPPKTIVRKKPYTMDATLQDVGNTFVGRIMKRFALKEARKMNKKTNSEWMNEVIERTLSETPIRTLATMSGGIISLKKMEGILDLINGHWIRGIRKL